MNKKTILKCFSVLLALSMLIAMLPAGAYAADAWDGSIDVSWYNTTDTSFTITTPAQLAGLAAIVNGTAEGIAKDSFAGKTITLGADIDLGNKNWTPIGQRTASSTYDSFAGIFDGCGHVISNLAITYDITGQFYTDGTANQYVGYIGLFGIVEGSDESRAVIKNLTLNGYVTLISSGSNTISEAFGFAGLVGVAKKTDITDCICDVDVTDNSSTSKNIQCIGGIIGLGYTLNISRCVNYGDVKGNASRDRYLGGIVGQLQAPPNVLIDCCNKGSIGVSSNINKNFGIVGGLIGDYYLSTDDNIDISRICNCYNTGVITGGTTGNAQKMTGAFIGHIINNKTLCAANNYYLDTSCTNAIGGSIPTGVEISPISKTSEELILPEFVTVINGNSAWKLGMTYPILVSQPDEVCLGDISRSGSIDENDVTYLIGHIIGTGLIDPSLASIGDMNGDSLIDENDVTYLIQSVLNVN